MRISCHSGSGLGGTQKAAWSYAIGLAKLGHEVAMVTDDGPMQSNFNAAGFDNLKVLSVMDERGLEDFLYSGWTEVAHVHVPGYAIKNRIYDIIDRRGHRPFRVIETNVFGRLKDPRADRHTDVRLFISMASGAQALRRSGLRDLSALALPHSVVYYPVVARDPIDRGERQAIRAELGVAEKDVLVIRTGRPDARKWGHWETKAFAHARAANSRIFFLQMQPPEKLQSEIESGKWGPGFICLDAIPDQGRITRLCQSADFMLHAARFGESFGYSIAEGMAAGLPIVTLSTPWGDNAQVELVKNAETGFVCSTLEGLTRAVLLLSNDESLRKSMGLAARNRIETLTNANQECQILSDFCTQEKEDVCYSSRTRSFGEFMRTFPLLERDVFENSSEFGWFSKVRGEWASSLRRARTRLSDTKADIRTAFGFPAYHNT